MEELSRYGFFLILVSAIWTKNFIKCATVLNLQNNAIESEPRVCHTQVCEKIAREIQIKMNLEANPCDDFYEYVCGDYEKNAVIPEDQPRVDAFTTLRKKVQENLRTSIEEIRESDPLPFRKLQLYYQTCMNEDLKNRGSVNEFLGILRELGNWPVLAGEDWNPAGYSIDKFREFGFKSDYFIRFSISPDTKNTSRRRFNILAPSLGIAKEYLSKGLEHKKVKAYFDYMLDLAEILGAQRDYAERELRESLELEIEIAKLSAWSSTYIIMDNVTELETFFPYVSWKDYIDKLLRPYAQIKPDESIGAYDVNYFYNISKLLNKTSSRAEANYAYWRLVAESAEFLNEEVRAAKSRLDDVISGSGNKKARWQQCVDRVNENMYLATSALYARRYFDATRRDIATDLVLELKKSFAGILKELDWMKNPTKEYAIEKLMSMQLQVGYPDEVLDDQKLDDFYRDLVIQPDSYLLTELNYNRFALKKYVENFRIPVVKDNWTNRGRSAAVVNAFYDYSSNTLKLPAGILQGEIFNVDQPQYANYAAVGTVAGHEIATGFDADCRHYDKNGNRFNWWDVDTEKEYQKKAECVVQQYGNYSIEEVQMKVNGKLTLPDNIADIGGLKDAYYAYDAWQKKYGDEPPLPGFENFTPKQLFWVSYASMYCSKTRPEWIANRIMTNMHAPARFRIVGPMSNLPEFSADFNCTLGSGMNPVDKCTFW